jgi:ATP-dependent Lhr-like helicase
MMDPRRKSNTEPTPGKRPTRSSAGRWSLLNEAATNAGAPSPAAGMWAEAPTTPKQRQDLRQSAIEQARRTDAALESAAKMLLARYGVLFRDLLARESNAPKWRDLLNILRRLEARGEIRGGRFLSGFGGEQYALPEAVESLRAARTRDCSAIITLAAADPINLVGIVIPGDRIPAVPGKQVIYRNGNVHSEDAHIPETSSPTNLPPQMIPPTSAPGLTLF